MCVRVCTRVHACAPKSMVGRKEEKRKRGREGRLQECGLFKPSIFSFYLSPGINTCYSRVREVKGKKVKVQFLFTCYRLYNLQ